MGALLRLGLRCNSLGFAGLACATGRWRKTACFSLHRMGWHCTIAATHYAMPGLPAVAGLPLVPHLAHISRWLLVALVFLFTILGYVWCPLHRCTPRAARNYRYRFTLFDLVLFACVLRLRITRDAMPFCMVRCRLFCWQILSCRALTHACGSSPRQPR